MNLQVALHFLFIFNIPGIWKNIVYAVRCACKIGLLIQLENNSKVFKIWLNPRISIYYVHFDLVCKADAY